MANKAAWIMEPRGNPLQVKQVEMPKAGPNEVVIKNHAVAVNPIDTKIQDIGIMLKTYPNVLGTNVAGKVYEIGEGVTHVKKGDRVMGHCFSIVTNAPRNGGFQLYSACNSLVVSKIPESLSYNSAAVLPLSISTAAALLFSDAALKLPFSTAGSTPASGSSLLVWGGSTSVGTSAIQLAVAAGIKVVTVAGKQNLETMRELGASAAFDYKDPNVAGQILDELQNTTFAGVCDCISTPNTVASWVSVQQKLGGRYGCVMPDPKGLPEGIQGSSIFAPMIALSERAVGKAIWAGYLPNALENGSFKAAIKPLVITGGLEKVQEGLDRQRKGVSLEKVVIDLSEG